MHELTGDISQPAEKSLSVLRRKCHSDESSNQKKLAYGGMKK